MSSTQSLCRDELLVIIYKIVFEAIRPRHLSSADEIAWGDILGPMAFRRESKAEPTFISGNCIPLSPWAIFGGECHCRAREPRRPDMLAWRF
jgi:hypothetical protein